MSHSAQQTNSEFPAFVAPYAADDVEIARRLLRDTRMPAADAERVKEHTRELVTAIRAETGAFGGIEELLREYSLSTKEGLALMVLAEALLRVPDAATANRLIEDKLGFGDFIHHEAKSNALLVNASAWALGVAASIVKPEDQPDSIIVLLAKRLGLPALRLATRQAMRLLGNHFVLGQTIEDALKRSQSGGGEAYRYSFDMLGEGARTAEDAKHYFDSYAHAIEAIGRAETKQRLPERGGISIKLSALHPVYEAPNRERVRSELSPLVLELARLARSFELNFTIDAEEADRLELSLDIFRAVLSDRALAGWEGFGLAVQAYQKRAREVIEWTADQAQALNRRLMVRLVKGAYWDTEIKRAQERGLPDYPVFTRKAMTDLNYTVCTELLLSKRNRIFSQFATHNATTVASVIVLAGGVEGYEFQRLHGMGNALYSHLLKSMPGVACRTYAPVGSHKNLLAYLVRRLLENGANSSFVSETADPSVPVERLLRLPAEIIGSPEHARHPNLRLPAELFAPARRNSAGIEFGHRTSVDRLVAEMDRSVGGMRACPIIAGKETEGAARESESPIGKSAGMWRVLDARIQHVDAAFASAARGFTQWSNIAAADRAAALDRTADLLEARRGRFLHLLQIEDGKTIDDAVSEVREAVDFCRYYAAEARRLLGIDTRMPGPTGETNILAYRARGIFVAISPWNFPLAIFMGQVTAALAAGNAVIAKPAEQTPVIAFEAIRLLHEAGVPPEALQFVPGDGKTGAQLVAHEKTAGVVFTGSTEVARLINRSLAAKDNAIVPLIAETGGINAMIADATALPEQVADDVVSSAFRSAGQRCSALRLLCIQEEVADAMIEMIVGAARELAIGDPRDFAVKVGPVIDSEAKANLLSHVEAIKKSAKLIYAGNVPDSGQFVAPHVIELKRAGELAKEVFGPILHVVRYRESELEPLLDEIGSNGYGLTLGVHSRIESTVERIVRRMPAGNIYVNRNMIGAVVGVQPFGGQGLSGTGPKAGGPNYLLRFMSEQTVTTNTAAAGGNAELLALDEADEPGLNA